MSLSSLVTQRKRASDIWMSLLNSLCYLFQKVSNQYKPHRRKTSKISAFFVSMKPQGQCLLPSYRTCYRDLKRSINLKIMWQLRDFEWWGVRSFKLCITTVLPDGRGNTQRIVRTPKTMNFYNQLYKCGH